MTMRPATPQLVLETAAATHGLSAVRESMVEWPERRAYRLRGGLVHGPTGIILYRGRHLVQSGPIGAASLKHLAADHYVSEELWLIEQLGDARMVTVPGAVHHTGLFGGNYYHWLVDVLPRVLNAHRSFPDLTVVIPEPPRFALEALEMLGVRYLVTSATVSADSIIVVDPGLAGWIHPVDVALLRSTFSARSDEDGSERIPGTYVSRVGSSRSMRDEEALERALIELGFHVVRPDSMPQWDAQVELFARSRAIIGPHGAGLANLVFAPSEARVIELIPAALNPEGTPGETGHFLRLATICGLSYAPVQLSRDSSAPYGDAEDVVEEVLGLLR